MRIFRCFLLRFDRVNDFCFDSQRYASKHNKKARKNNKKRQLSTEITCHWQKVLDLNLKNDVLLALLICFTPLLSRKGKISH